MAARCFMFGFLYLSFCLYLFAGTSGLRVTDDEENWELSEDHHDDTVNDARKTMTQPMESNQIVAQSTETEKLSTEAPLPATLCAKFPRPEVAICFHGSVRSFRFPLVHRSMQRNLIEGLGAKSTTFLHVTLKDNRGDLRKGFDGLFPEATREEILHVASLLGVTEKRAKILDGPNADLPKCKNYESAYAKRRANTEGHEMSMDYLYSLAGQVSHKEGCMKLIREDEKQRGRQFDEVILSRADLTYYMSLPPYCMFKHDTKARRFRDWYAHVPRERADGLFSTAYNLFYNCKKNLADGEWVESYINGNIEGKFDIDDPRVPVQLTRLDKPGMPHPCGTFHTGYEDEVPNLCGAITHENPTLQEK